MRKMYMLFLVFTCGVLTYGQTAKNDMMPITTKSDAARKLFYEASRAYEDANVEKGSELLLKAKAVDPGFFMADYYLSMASFGNNNLFTQYANEAVNCKGKLNQAEELLKLALSRLIENQKADVTDIGRQLVSMYPKDDMVYWCLYFFQRINNDQKGCMETLSKALEISDYPGPIYNTFGYIFMDQERNEDALAAFDKYIELSPDNPNAYDSKGDYFFKIKEYEKAYDSFMKAYNMGFKYSYDKAQKAKHIADSLGK
jgi:tetratricopeptide (TPR) repeat protein